MGQTAARGGKSLHNYLLLGVEERTIRGDHDNSKNIRLMLLCLTVQNLRAMKQ
jgi:hypothetical protein